MVEERIANIGIPLDCLGFWRFNDFLSVDFFLGFWFFANKPTLLLWGEFAGAVGMCHVSRVTCHLTCELFFFFFLLYFCFAFFLLLIFWYQSCYSHKLRD